MIKFIDDFNRFYTKQKPKDLEVINQQAIEQQAVMERMWYKFVVDPVFRLYTQIWRRTNIKYYLPPALYFFWRTIEVSRDKEILNQVEFRPWQEKVLQKIEEQLNIWKPQLLVRAPTGAGKSWFISFLTRYFDEKICIVVPTLEIANQVVENAKKFFGVKVSLLQWSKANLTDKVVMHYQTFNKLYNRLNWQYPVLIVDEAHKLPKERVKQINLWKSRKMILAFTATPNNKRMWKEGLKLFWGDVIWISDDEVDLVDPIVKVVRNIWRFKYEEVVNVQKAFNLSEQNQNLSTYLVYSKEERLERLKNVIRELIDSWYKKIIILVDHKRYLKKTYKFLFDNFQTNGVLEVFYIDWDVKKKDRQRILTQLRQKDGFILVVQKKIWSEWFDLPTLDAGILFYPTKWEVLVEQAIWRIRRLYPGKKWAIWIDFADAYSIEWSKPKWKWYYDRKQKYKEMWFKILEINWEYYEKKKSEKRNLFEI